MERYQPEVKIRLAGIVSDDAQTEVSIADGESLMRSGDDLVGFTPAIGELPESSGKGDLLVFNGTQYVRLPVGANGQVLTVDSTEPTGLKWADGA